MTNTCTNCRYSQTFSTLNVGPGETRKELIICKHEEAKKSTNFVQPTFSCVYHEIK